MNVYITHQKNRAFSVYSIFHLKPISASLTINSIKSILSKFLWKGQSLQKYENKVAWDKVALPYQEGRLNIKQLVDWNQALILIQKNLHITKQNKKKAKKAKLPDL